MSTSVVPGLIDALVAACTTGLPLVNILDGVGDTNDPGDYLMIGVQDPDVEPLSPAADSSETPATFGTNRSRDERGTLWFTAYSWNGDGDQKAARDAAYATTAYVATLVRQRATPPFGISALITVEFATDSQRLAQGQFTVGAVAQVMFGINYRARL